MSIFKDGLIRQGASVPTSSVYAIDQSIRFNDNDSPALKKTYSSAGTEETFTFSCWVKRGNIGASLGGSGNYGLTLFSGGSNVSNYGEIRFESSGYGTQDSLFFYNSTGGSINMQLATTQLFRDTSAWYHVVCVMDTTNNISSERLRMYINGERVTSFGSETYPAKDTVPNFNTATEHGVGVFAVDTDTRHFDGYLAEIHFLDGYAYGPEYFGEFNSSNIWIPKEYTGSYGNNGFKIDGRDSSDLGDDESGNGNDYTASGLAAHDQVLDTPTNNFNVMNPNNTNSSMTLSNGNLQSTASAHTGSGGTILLPSTGKWYCEFRYNNASVGEYPVVGVYNTIKNLSTSAVNPGINSGDLDIGFGADGRRNEDNTNTSSWGNSVGDNKIGALAIDMTNKKIWFGHNNSGSFVWQASGNPSAGSNEANTKDFADDLIFGNSHYSGSIIVWNFGQDGTFGGTETAQGNSDANGLGNFYYALPTGYLALCTRNLGS